jgi:hypothetical protein
MKSKFYPAVSVVLALAFVVLLGTAAADAPFPCDPGHVVKSGRLIHITPTGLDDTANIQCAIDAAVTGGPGMTIRLAPGTFRTKQIYIHDFVGTLRGSGVHQTTIVNLPNLYVEPDHGVPAPDNPQPYLFSFFGGDYTVAHLTFRAVGEQPTTLWSWPGCENNHVFHGLIGVFGDEVHANFFQIAIRGRATESAHYGYNIMQGIFALGVMGDEMPPIAGKIHITHSTFRGLTLAAAFFNLKDADVAFNTNTVSDAWEAVDFTDQVDSQIMVANNRITVSDVGIAAYNAILPADVNTDYVVRNNIIKGPSGIRFLQTVDEDNVCLIKNNNLRWVTGTSIVLGDGAAACKLHNNRE